MNSTGPPSEESARQGALSKQTNRNTGESLHNGPKCASRVVDIPWQLSDITNLYDRELITAHLPPPYVRELKLAVKPWFDGTSKFALEGYAINMRRHFRDLAKADERGPFDLILKLANHTGGAPWSPILASWIGELLSCVHPKDDSVRLKKRVAEAMRDPSPLWPAAVDLGEEIWNDEKLSTASVHTRINNWLADHCAAHLFYGVWIRRQVWPQTFRSEPTITEKRTRDVMAAWGSVSAEDAVFGAQLQRTFGIAIENYNPDHPLAHRVKIESPLKPALGQKAWMLIFSILPLIRHHQWSAADICRVLVILRPDLAAQWAARKRDDGPKYVREHILTKIGLAKAAAGRRKTGRPTGFNLARLVCENLQTLPRF
jgi:hypothetical protein